MPVITFKVSAAEARAIKARAKARHTTVSGYLRQQVLPARKTRGRIVIKTHRASGLTYDASAGAAVTPDEIAAALADFP